MGRSGEGDSLRVVALEKREEAPEVSVVNEPDEREGLLKNSLALLPSEEIQDERRPDP